MDRICKILKIKLTAGVHLSLPWGYIHAYDNDSQFIGIYPRSQVSVYRTIGPLVYILLTQFFVIFDHWLSITAFGRHALCNLDEYGSV